LLETSYEFRDLIPSLEAGIRTQAMDQDGEIVSILIA
jgi:hypothetical protein